MNRDPCLTRRTVLLAVGGAVVLLAVPRALPRMPLLRGTEPDAVALEFVPDVAQFGPSAPREYSPGNRCGRCYFFQGRESRGPAPCTVFAGWRVPASGWCREFKARV